MNGTVVRKSTKCNSNYWFPQRPQPTTSWFIQAIRKSSFHCCSANTVLYEYELLSIGGDVIDNADAAVAEATINCLLWEQILRLR